MEEDQNPTSKPVSAKRQKLQKKPGLLQSGFPIVGIGASAGGLEALEAFLSNVNADLSMAYVVVQHLDPTHKGILVELLQRSTSMPVMQVKDRMRVKAGCVYVIPPNKDMSILHGVLHLMEPAAPRGLRLPIDYFLRSLAEDQQERSIGVILSGMGSDGSLGLRAIKERAGVTFAQEPGSARFDSMPRSAIEAGVVDVVTQVEAMPGRILDYLRHLPLITGGEPQEGAISQSSFEKVVILLRSQTGHDFSLYKKNTIYRRIERRMGLHQIDRITSYVRFLQENPQEVELLFRELLIGVTSFFRDGEVWEQVKNEVLPKVFAEHTQSQTLRAWIPACATGEEAYSLAIIFKEALEQYKPEGNLRLQIFATDLDPHSIEKAREGLFPENIAADVSAERLDRYFVKLENGYQVTKGIREMIVFAPQNVIMDPPFTRLDIVSCRNLLIYLSPDLQMKVLPLFHYSLNPGGYLLLGSAESIGSFSNLFEALPGKARLYRRSNMAQLPESLTFPSHFTRSAASQPVRFVEAGGNLQAQAEQLILRNYAPAAVLTNERGEILYTSGRTGRYLEPATGRANWNILVMAREGAHYDLTGSFQKALREQEAVTIKNVSVTLEGLEQVVDISIDPLKAPGTLKGLVLIVFSEHAQAAKARAKSQSRAHNGRVTELEQALTQARQEAQSLREEMQSSQEELRSTNEELQSTNEEIQSTNEELTTSKEELQSINEELHTVNKELQTRVEELAHANNDMKNLLDSTNLATLFLDNALCVRRFTSETSKITRLRPSDVGRPITDIASALLYPELAENVREVLSLLVRNERQIHTPNGNWYAVRIQPYRTLENRIDGVVITFTDITAYKMLEAELRQKKHAN